MKRVLLFLTTAALAGCSANLKNISVDSFANAKGVPWVESKSYEVKIYQIGANSSKDRLLEFGVYELSDRVNGEEIDAARSKWTVNYSAGPFAKGGLKLTMHPNGTLKMVSIDSEPQVKSSGDAATAVVSIEDEIEKKEVERLKRELERRETQNKLDALDEPDE